MTDCAFGRSIVNMPEVTRKSVHIIIENGCVVEAFADEGVDVDIIVYDLDTQDPDMRAEVEESIAALKQNTTEVDIL